MTLLALCADSAARSTLLECSLDRACDGRVTAFSAGSRPSGRLHAQSVDLLAMRDHSTDGFAAAQAPECIPDPAAAQAPDWPNAFQSADDILSRAVRALLDLPTETVAQTDIHIAPERIANL